MNVLLWAMPLLLIATIAVSSAGAAFALVFGVSGALKAAWRLQVCSYALLIIQLYDWYYRRDECCRMWHQGWKYILISGALLGAHFVFFAASIDNTSIAHSLIIVTSSPIALILYSLATGKPVYKWEVLGVGISFFGLFLVILDIGSGDDKASWYGDMQALIAMIVITAYLFNAQTMLKERGVPLIAYFAPVNVVASLTAYFFAIFEGEGDMFFDWTDTIYFWPVVYLGLIPGVLGHLSINYLISFISLILITVTINLEPLFGTFIGWSFGLQSTPSFLLFTGGIIAISGNMIVTVMGRDNATGKKSDVSLQDKLSELTKPFK
mmetsp:Transcript_2007/g.4521  ORF Transcript_2007/g.4521 Transcript_2007/m.4521 type:complete len:323 (+) Transcript_2007:3789-4757(+)|eukprot:CAMPEP_0204899682 /NCGR_PEP_ID=MMETSP1397-20131031/1993_1 /ASSEMBLY_ACC=CAM_ASM_000891 /TAXON_ID=49980 /ORGANISM="Climacostomum Climacostomum virens, Strain Stock W-24" /LENGTH=322 /DNA_ID=CAMNT_0052067665 /DNA_START=1260 /DNA_END=2228 /DNA_ORIENTATION=-